MSNVGRPRLWGGEMGMRASTRVAKTKALVAKFGQAGIYPHKGIYDNHRKEIARTIKHMRKRPLSTLRSKRDQALAKKLGNKG